MPQCPFATCHTTAESRSTEFILDEDLICTGSHNLLIQTCGFSLTKELYHVPSTGQLYPPPRFPLSSPALFLLVPYSTSYEAFGHTHLSGSIAGVCRHPRKLTPDCQHKCLADVALLSCMSPGQVSLIYGR